MKRFTAAFAALLACAGCASNERASDEDRWALAAANPVAPPVSCIPISRIDRTAARDNRTIDFITTDGRTLRNRLPNGCGGLHPGRALMYRTSLDRLCSTDTITLLESDGAAGPSCGLGMFQEVAVPPRTGGVR